MSRNRIITQAIAGGIIYLVISLVLERSMASEALVKEGTEALIFAVVYGAGLWVYHRYFKKEG